MKLFIPIIFLITLLFSQIVEAQKVVEKLESPEALIEAIHLGGYILYMRHGITKRKDKHKVLVDISRCDTQRNLTAEGLKQVQYIGKVIKSLNIPIGKVKSSPYCRTKDTAQAVFDNYEIDEKLAFSISKAQKESEMLGAHLYNSMMAVNDPVGNTVFVGHTANLKDGLGVWPKPEGVVVVFKKEEGNIVYKGMIKPNDWPQL